MAGNLNCEESSSAPHPQEEASQNSQVDERQAFVLLTFMLFSSNFDFEWRRSFRMKALAQNESPTIREKLVEELASNSLERHDGIELTDDPYHFLNEGYFLPDQILEKMKKVK